MKLETLEDRCTIAVISERRAQFGSLEFSETPIELAQSRSDGREGLPNILEATRTDGEPLDCVHLTPPISRFPRITHFSEMGTAFPFEGMTFDWLATALKGWFESIEHDTSDLMRVWIEGCTIETEVRE